MGLLDGDIAALFGTAFIDLYLDGTLHQGGTTPVYDEYGNITGYAGGADTAIKVQRDNASYAMRQADGYSDGDVMLIILAQDIGPVTTDMQVTDGYGVRWMVASANLDAAASHWICRGAKV